MHSHFNVRLQFSWRSTTFGMDYEWVVTFVVLYPVEKLDISFGICNNGTFLLTVFQEKSICKAFFGRRTQECTLKFEMVKHVFDMLPRPVNAILELVLMLVALQQAYHHGGGHVSGESGLLAT